ncbi:hypothetical protein F5Y08DRAFT_330897 [Xylaria arbuscula]|nr:hypothetical protein F5Y08DRAFT_330897 [Xylaria arbuscula]
MSIAYICDDGKARSIREAMKHEPLRVRGLLFDALLEPCLQELPDTLEMLRLESAFRRAFANFKEEERMVKSYLLTRWLQSHVPGTYRGSLIPLALHIGGPCALASLFYATIDSHRNVENAKLLKLLEENVTQESREDLFRRANAFPPSPSFDRWLGKLLQKADSNTISLVRILSCLGTPEVPRIIFDRMHFPARRWGLDGQVYLSASQLAYLIRDPIHLEKALQFAETMGWATVTSDKIHVNQRLTRVLLDHPDIHQWKASAVQLLLHALPTHVGLDPENYNTLHETMLPQTKHVIPYLKEFHVTPYLSVRPDPGLREAIELCLATSYFSDHEWKQKALSIGRDLLDTLIKVKTQPNEALAQRFKFRELRYSMLRTAASTFDGAQNLELPHPDTAAANAWSADLILLQAHDCMKFNLFESATRKLAQYSPVFRSDLERFQEARIDAARGVICRYRGLFRKSQDILSKIECPNSTTLVHLLVVECELGGYDRVLAKVSAWLRLSPRPDSKAALRIRLAAINAKLVGGLSLVASGDSWPGWREVCTMYEDLWACSRLSWFDRLAILIGIAMAQHVYGELSAASNAWKEVHSACKECHLSGYTEKVIDWSLCELEMRQGQQPIIEASQRLEGLSDGARREYIFTGLGTIWVTVLHCLVKKHGFEPE